MKNSLWVLVCLWLAIGLSSCGNEKTPFLHIHQDASVTLQSFERLDLTKFNFRLEELVNQQDSLPFDLHFEADANTAFPVVWKVKESLRKYASKINLKLITSSGEQIAEKLEKPLMGREHYDYSQTKSRNLLSLYLGADQQIYEDAGLTKPLTEDLATLLTRFIKSDPESEELPELHEAFLPGVGSVQSSKFHRIRVVPTMTTDYAWYSNIRQQVAAVYASLYDELSQKYFGKTYAEGNNAERKIAEIVYPIRVVDDPNIVY